MFCITNYIYREHYAYNSYIYILFRILQYVLLAEHIMVIFLIRTTDDVFPPVLMFQIPFNSFLDAVFEFRLRKPAELIMDFSRVDSVAAVVPFTVGHVFDEGFRFAELVQNGLDDVDIGAFIMSADIVDFAFAACADNQVDSRAVVFHIEPIADVLAITVNR